jgi:hypothetical protein
MCNTLPHANRGQLGRELRLLSSPGYSEGFHPTTGVMSKKQLSKELVFSSWWTEKNTLLSWNFSGYHMVTLDLQFTIRNKPLLRIHTEVYQKMPQRKSPGSKDFAKFLANF